MRDPVHHGLLDNANAVGEVGNPACGDLVTLHLRIEDDKVVAAGFESLGSPYQLATASVLCDCVLGFDLAHARQRTPMCVLEKLPDLPRRNRYLARLAIEALHRALAAFDHGGGDAPLDTPPRSLDESEADAFLLDLLANGKAWSTADVEKMVEAAGIALPASVPRWLARLKRDGRVLSQLDPEAKAFRWRITTGEASPAGA